MASRKGSSSLNRYVTVARRRKRDGLLQVDVGTDCGQPLMLPCGSASDEIANAQGLFGRLKMPLAEKLGDACFVSSAFTLLRDEAASPGFASRALMRAVMKACLALAARRRLDDLMAVHDHASGWRLDLDRVAAVWSSPLAVLPTDHVRIRLCHVKHGPGLDAIERSFSIGGRSPRHLKPPTASRHNAAVGLSSIATHRFRSNRRAAARDVFALRGGCFQSSTA